MSLFYKSLTYAQNLEFQNRKRAFKMGKACKICGQTLPLDQMVVAHLIPVRELTDEKALFNEQNWEVRCIDCERRLHHEEQLRNNAKAIESPEKEDLKIGILQEKRQKLLRNRRTHNNVRKAQQELQAKRLQNSGGRRKGKHKKYQHDDYYDRFE